VRLAGPRAVARGLPDSVTLRRRPGDSSAGGSGTLVRDSRIIKKQGTLRTATMRRAPAALLSGHESKEDAPAGTVAPPIASAAVAVHSASSATLRDELTAPSFMPLHKSRACQILPLPLLRVQPKSIPSAAAFDSRTARYIRSCELGLVRLGYLSCRCSRPAFCVQDPTELSNLARETLRPIV